MAEKTSTGQATSKMDGVRRALDTLGQDATPARIQAFLQKEFGIEMPTNDISSYKGKIRRRAAEEAKTPAAPQATRTTHAVPAPAPKATGVGIALDDIVALKALVGRVGAEQLRRLIEVLAK